MPMAGYILMRNMADDELGKHAFYGSLGAVGQPDGPTMADVRTGAAILGLPLEAVAADADVIESCWQWVRSQRGPRLALNAHRLRPENEHLYTSNLKLMDMTFVASIAGQGAQATRAEIAAASGIVHAGPATAAVGAQVATWLGGLATAVPPAPLAPPAPPLPPIQPAGADAGLCALAASLENGPARKEATLVTVADVHEEFATTGVPTVLLTYTAGMSRTALEDERIAYEKMNALVHADDAEFARMMQGPGVDQHKLVADYYEARAKVATNEVDARLTVLFGRLAQERLDARLAMLGREQQAADGALQAAAAAVERAQAAVGLAVAAAAAGGAVVAGDGVALAAAQGVQRQAEMVAQTAAGAIVNCEAERVTAAERVAAAITRMCEHEMEHVQKGSVAKRNAARRHALTLVSGRASGLTFKKLYALAAAVATPINTKRIDMHAGEGRRARGACVGWWHGMARLHPHGEVIDRHP